MTYTPTVADARELAQNPSGCHTGSNEWACMIVRLADALIAAGVHPNTVDAIATNQSVGVGVRAKVPVLKVVGAIVEAD